MADRYLAHIISQTHWDREWYETFQSFRMRLVELMDFLIELLETTPEYKYFHLDGQTIVLEDYLEIRPENKERLAKLINEGRILIGPWYDQPDENLVSGESLIRNFIMGHKIGKKWKNWMKVGYIPDMFGHISQFPQILRGIGIDNAVLFRGITTDQVDAEFNWESPDGSSVLAMKMPDNTAYSNFFYRLRGTLSSPCQIDFDKALEEINVLISDCITERPTTNQFLFMDGVDHIFPNPKTPEIIAGLNPRIAPDEMVHSTLPDFISAVRFRNPKLKTVVGELRHTNRRWRIQGLLAGTLSSRVNLKQMNHLCETELEKWAEPFSTISYTLGYTYPESYLSLSWKWLLKNQPHDSICGCSIDQVHKDMVYRFDQSLEISRKVTRQALGFIASKINTESILSSSAFKKGINTFTDMFSDGGKEISKYSTALAVFNPLNFQRSDIVDTIVDFPVDIENKDIVLLDSEGNEVPVEVLSIDTRHDQYQPKFDIPNFPRVKRYKIKFFAREIPSLGYKTFIAVGLDCQNRQIGSLRTSNSSMENKYLEVQIQQNGTLKVTDKIQMLAFTDCMQFEDSGDLGDGYNYVKPLGDTLVTSLGSDADISVVEDGPSSCTFKVEIIMDIPGSADGDKSYRSLETVPYKITNYVTLGAESRRVDIVTRFDNTAKDHRLRVLFPSDISTDFSNAEVPYDVVKRPVVVPECRDWLEAQPAFHPMKSFVDVCNDQAGLAVSAKGLQEYEVKYDTRRTIAVTLLRAVGHGVGGPENQVEGQMQGIHTFEYSIIPHTGSWSAAKVWMEAHAFNVPFRTVMVKFQSGNLPASLSFMRTDVPGLVLSTLKKADDSDKLVLRFYNTTDQSVTGKISLYHEPVTVESSNLLEEPVGDVSVDDDGTIIVQSGRKKISTLLIGL